jgi:hypothetical protein
MKRLVSVLVSLVLMVSCFSSALAAEDFTLRSGIKFGDTLEEVLDKEKTLTREGEDGGTFKGKIAGYSDAKCIFSFDDDGKLIDMRYTFKRNISSRDEMNSVYQKLYDGLKRQYGNPLGNTGGTTHLITGSAIAVMTAIVGMISYLNGYSGDYADYDEWVIGCDDYHVKIDIISFYTKSKDYTYVYYVELSYHCFTDEEYAAAVREKEGEIQEVDDDL